MGSHLARDAEEEEEVRDEGWVSASTYHLSAALEWQSLADKGQLCKAEPTFIIPLVEEEE